MTAFPAVVPEEPVADLLHQALALHRTGQLPEAALLYERILRQDPQQVDALHLLGVIANQQGDSIRAQMLIRQAISRNPKHASFHANLALAYKAQGQYAEALQSCEQALALRNDQAEVWYNRGLILQELQRLPDAVESWSRALALKPDYPEARGRILLQRGENEVAISCFEQVLARHPDQVDAWLNLGNALFACERKVLALAAYERVLALQPRMVNALCNRGIVLHQLGHVAVGLRSLDLAIEYNPRFAAAYSNRGVVLRQQGRNEEALRDYDQALALDPAYPEAWYNRGIALYAFNQLDESIRCCDKAIALRADYTSAYWNKSIALLTQGNLEAGWPLYEYRWRSVETGMGVRKLPGRAWLGNEPLAGKRILLYAEQGLGDTLQFCRYAALIAAQGAYVILEVQPELVALLQGLDGVDELLAQGSPLPAYDLHCPLLSLPLACHTCLDNIPVRSAYLRSQAIRRYDWAARLGEKRLPRVGLVWRGSPQHKNDLQRSLPLAKLLPSLASGIEYVSLQLQPRAEDLPVLAANPAIRQLGPQLGGFTDTAALCDLLDLVICVDTSVAHLCGALGKACWLLLPFCPDWRWMLERGDSPWYPALRLYRQPAPGDWDSLLLQLGEDLAQWLDQQHLPA